jgi:poly-gamma-glutamate synthesis protein (capsule biosynthesis protein)
VIALIFTKTYNYVSNIISSANLAIGNLETVIGGKEIGYSGYPTFNSPIDFVEGIKNAGFDFLITVIIIRTIKEKRIG